LQEGKAIRRIIARLGKSAKKHKLRHGTGGFDWNCKGLCECDEPLTCARTAESAAATCQPSHSTHPFAFRSVLTALSTERRSLVLRHGSAAQSS